MNIAQSPHIPPKGQKPAWTDMRWLATYSARGLWELVRARLIFSRFEAKSIRTRNRTSKERADMSASLPPDVLARIGYVLPRLSDRLPWRSDCLIQAIAAQNWLTAYGVGSEIQIGVEKPEGGEFGAHAWLLHGEKVVTGGEIERYHVLLADSPSASESRTSSSSDLND